MRQAQHLALAALALSLTPTFAVAERNLVPTLDRSFDVCPNRPAEPVWMQEISLRPGSLTQSCGEGEGGVEETVADAQKLRKNRLSTIVKTDDQQYSLYYLMGNEELQPW